MKRFEGVLSITRRRSGDREDTVHIRIDDEVSRDCIVDIDVSVADWGDAVSAPGQVKCQVQLRGLEHIGKKRAFKTIVIKNTIDRYVHDYDKRYELGKKLLEPYETDGWEGDVDDLFNHHRWADGDPNTYSVRFMRYEEVE